MIKIYPEDHELILEYTIEQGDPQWVIDKFKEDGQFTIRRTFTFQIEQLIDDEILNKVKNISTNDSDISEMNVFDIFDHDSIRFRFGVLSGDYYEIVPGIITYSQSVFIDKNIRLEAKLFTSHRNISVFSKIERIISADIYIGGQQPSAIPEDSFRALIAKFPSTHQRDLYESALISSVFREYLDSVPDYTRKYEDYLNKKKGFRPSTLLPSLREQELFKYTFILEKLEHMLADEQTINELQWQEEILAIITLLYPKYIQPFKSVAIHRKNQTKLFVDILMVDSGGYVDIVEIKKPSDVALVSQGLYRNNHVPYRELTGTIMQIEKYIYYLNRWGPDGEKVLSSGLENLPDGFEVKLTNPGGLVIMGRDNNLTASQKADFEIVKRKYKNILDILTYDELIRRLKFTIALWEKQN